MYTKLVLCVCKADLHFSIDYLKNLVNALKQKNVKVDVNQQKLRLKTASCLKL